MSRNLYQVSLELVVTLFNDANKTAGMTLPTPSSHGSEMLQIVLLRTHCKFSYYVSHPLLVYPNMFAFHQNQLAYKKLDELVTLSMRYQQNTIQTD